MRFACDDCNMEEYGAVPKREEVASKALRKSLTKGRCRFVTSISQDFGPGDSMFRKGCHSPRAEVTASSSIIKTLAYILPTYPHT